MNYSTRILLDSISPGGRRLTTVVLTYWRAVHAELMTHRLFSRNSASSRAIPIQKMIKQVLQNPAHPLWWGKNQAGMQAREELAGWRKMLAVRVFMFARYFAVAFAWLLWKLGLHKQVANRLLEPWMWITVIVSSTYWDNFFHLRDHWQAQPEIAWVARDLQEKFKASKPSKLIVGEWHLPLIEAADCTRAIAMAEGHHGRAVDVVKKVSTGRVARVSLLTHEGTRDLHEDVGLHDKLLAGQQTGDPLHMSPFEHIAQCLADPNEQSGNFRGWAQYRKSIPNEHYGEALP